MVCRDKPNLSSRVHVRMNLASVDVPYTLRVAVAELQRERWTNEQWPEA